MRKVLIAGVLGGIAMFFWSAIAHMALPLGEAGVRQVEHEDALLAAMRATLPGHGLYMFPAMRPGATQAQMTEKMATGPSGIMVYFPRRDFSFGASLGVEFLTETLQALIGAYLVWRMRTTGLGGAVTVFALVGLAAVISTNLSYANWYGFPATYTAAYMFTGWMGYIFAGLAVGAMKVGAPEPAMRAAALR